MLLYSFVLEVFRYNYIVPISKPKECYSKSLTFNGFRGIAIRAILFKLFEHCIVNRFPLLWSPYVIGQTIIFLPCSFFMVALCNRADHNIFMLFLLLLLMVALCNRADHYIFILFLLLLLLLLLSFFLSFFFLLA